MNFNKSNKTEQECCEILNKYEAQFRHICDTKSLIAFIKYYDDERKKEMVKQYHRSEGNKHKFIKDFFELTDEDIAYQDCSQMKVSLKAEDTQGNIFIIRTNATKLKEMVEEL